MKKEITGYLIMNADDYGPSDYINEGIIKGIQEGVVSSISVFVTYHNNRFIKNFEQKLILLIEEVKKAEEIYKRSIGIGLHLSLNAGKPISDTILIPKLLSKHKKSIGYFKHFYDITITETYCQQASIEIKNQIGYLDKLLKKYNKSVDHINHHVGFVSFHKALWETFINEAKIANLPIRSPLGYMNRSTDYYTTGSWSGVFKEGITQAFGKIFRNISNGKFHKISDSMWKLITNREELMEEKYEHAKLKGMKMPLSFNDNYYNEATTLKAHNFLESFKQGEVKEFMLHLSLDTPELKISVPHGFNKRSFRRRYLELKVLLDENNGLRNKIINEQFETEEAIYRLKLINYQNIPNKE